MIYLFVIACIFGLAAIALSESRRAERMAAALREIAGWEDNGNGTARRLKRIAEGAL